MHRLIRFCVLSTIRVMAVLTVVFWGASQVRVMEGTVDAGYAELSTAAVTGGFVFGASRGSEPATGVRTYETEDHLSWEGMYQINGDAGVDRKSVIFGGTMWLKRNSNSMAIGIRYWLALTMLLLTYAAVKFFAMKKRISRMAELEL